jgi:hypothetical protein
MGSPILPAQLTVVPANQAAWADLQVSDPSPHRVVMRIDFRGVGAAP